VAFCSKIYAINIFQPLTTLGIIPCSKQGLPQPHAGTLIAASCPSGTGSPEGAINSVLVFFNS
jgi:hypothetical protein